MISGMTWQTGVNDVWSEVTKITRNAVRKKKTIFETGDLVTENCASMKVRDNVF